MSLFFFILEGVNVERDRFLGQKEFLLFLFFWDFLGSDGKRQRSAVWQYFIKSENVGMSQCTICSEIVKHANNTSNLFKVLLVHSSYFL